MTASKYSPQVGAFGKNLIIIYCQSQTEECDIKTALEYLHMFVFLYGIRWLGCCIYAYSFLYSMLMAEVNVAFKKRYEVLIFRGRMEELWWIFRVVKVKPANQLSSPECNAIIILEEVFAI